MKNVGGLTDATSNPRVRLVRFIAGVVFLSSLLALPSWAVNVDLVINVDSDKPSYKSTELQTFTVTVTNNGPDAATGVSLVVNHPSAGLPFETTASCTATLGAVCPASYAGLPSQNLSATIPLIPNQGKVVIQFQVLPPLVCRGQGAVLPKDPCIPTEFDTGRILITAQATNGATEGYNVTNVATTNIMLYPPPIGYRVVITSVPAGPLLQGAIADYEFEVQSLGTDPSGPLRVALQATTDVGTSTAIGTSTFIPGTTLLSITCLSAPVGLVVFPPFACPGSSPTEIPLLTQGPLTATANSLVGFSPTAVANIPGVGGALKFKASFKVGTPRCGPTAGAVSRDLRVSVSVFGSTEAPLISTGADNTANTVTAVTATCLEANIQTALTVAPLSTTATSASPANQSTLSATFSNISGIGGGIATNVPFSIDTGAHPAVLGPITVTVVSCTPSGGGVCPTPLSSITVAPASSSQKTISGLIPSLPPGASIVLTVLVVEGATVPICSFGVIVSPSAFALPDPALTDPNYDPVTFPITWGNNRAVPSLGVNATGSNTASPLCGGGGTSVFVNVTKTGAFTSNSGSDIAAGSSSSAYVAPGTVVYGKVVIQNIGAVAADLTQLFDSASIATTFAATGGFVPTGAGLTPASWGATCVATLGATCFDAASSAAGPYRPNIAFKYDPVAYPGGSVPLPPGATLTYYIPFTMPAPALTSTTPPCAIAAANSASISITQSNGGTSSSTVNQFSFVGYPSCDTRLGITKTVALPATPSSIPVSGLVSYTVVVTNLSTTQTIGIPRFADSPNVSPLGSATLVTVSVTCGSPTLGALCPGPVPIGTQVRVGLPLPVAIPANDIDLEWGSSTTPTMPPGSSLTFTVTVLLSAPSKFFNGTTNTASFKAQKEPLAWTPVQASVSIFPPRSPIISVQKRVASQIVAGATFAVYTVDVVNASGAPATNVQLIDNLAASLTASNPSGYSLVTCADLSTAAFIPVPKTMGVCPSPSALISTATGLNLTIPSLGSALAPNSALRFTYRALMPSSNISVENFVSVTPTASGGGLSFNAGAAQAQANVQVLGALPAVIDPPAMVPTLRTWLMVLLAALLSAISLLYLRRRRLQ